MQAVYYEEWWWQVQQNNQLPFMQTRGDNI